MKFKIYYIVGFLLISACSSENFIRLYTLKSPDSKFEIKIDYTEPSWATATQHIFIESEEKINGETKKLANIVLKMMVHISQKKT